MKLFESEKTFAFLDIGPLSKGHAVRLIATAMDFAIANISNKLVIPKYHGAKLADIPDDQLSEILVINLPP